MGSSNTMYVIKNKSFYKNMHFKNISHNGTFYVNSTTKNANIRILVHQNILNRTFFPGLWDTKMLV